jgi:hypothetical protein
MPEFASFLFEHLGAAAIIVFFGFIADYFSTTEFKKDVARWLTSRKKIVATKANVTKVLTAFLQGFLYRIYGSKLFSVGFFIRSSAVSLLFLTVALCIQGIYHSNFDDEVLVSSYLGVGIAIFASLIFFNFVIDYVSNVQTISLLRMAAESGRILDVLVVFFADIALTITLFTLLFPVGIVVGAVATEALRPPTEFFVQVTDDNPQRKLKILEKFPDLKSKRLEVRERFEENALISRNDIRMRVLISSSDEGALVDKYFEALKNSGWRATVLRAEGDGLIVNLRPGPLRLNFSFLRYLYYSAFTAANVTRDAFLIVLRVTPFAVSLQDVYQYTDRYYGSGNRIQVRCDTGKTLNVSEEEEIDCNVVFATYAAAGLEPFWHLRRVVASGEHFPISPFFITSFASSVLYYFALLLLGLGIFVVRMLGRLFSIRHLETTTKPFALLSVVLFVFVELGWLLFRLIAS